MRSVFVILTIFYSSLGLCGNEEVAARQTINAVLKTEHAKKITKKVQRVLENALPLEKETATVIGTTAMTLANGRVNTKDIKNLDMNLWGGRVRADVEYEFKTQKTDAYIKLKWNLD